MLIVTEKVSLNDAYTVVQFEPLSNVNVLVNTELSYPLKYCVILFFKLTASVSFEVHASCVMLQFINNNVDCCEETFSLSLSQYNLSVLDLLRKLLYCMKFLIQYCYQENILNI